MKSDYEVGLNALKYFYNEQRSRFPKLALKSLDELVKVLESRKGGKNFLLGLGLGINLGEIPEYRVRTAMETLAINSGGKIPLNNNDFRNYLINEATKVSYVDAVTYTVIESTKDITKGVAEVGETVLTTGKVISFIMPFLPFIILYVLYRIVKNDKVLENLSGLAKLK